MANHTFSVERGCFVKKGHGGKALGTQLLKAERFDSEVKYGVPARAPFV